MALTLPLCFKLKYSVTGTVTTLEVNESINDVCAELQLPTHITATIYTISSSEKILIHGCEDGKLIVQRGFEGSPKCPFPSGACIKINEVIPGAVCETDTLGNDCPDIWSRLVVGKGLTLDRSDPDNPVLALSTTGVSAAEMCGATINACGQFTYVPPNWPASCMPTFDPCCSDSSSGGGSGSSDACSIAFEPPFGSNILTQDTVCGALEDLQNAINEAGAGGPSISTITAGACITIGGTTTQPIIGVTASGIAPGTYNGLTVNECGQVTGYSPVAAGITPIQGDDAITATYVPGTGYVISISEATIDQCGCVLLADEGELTTPPNLTTMPGDSVVTIAFLDAWATAKGL